MVGKTFDLKTKFRLLILLSMLPFIVLLLYLLVAMKKYSNSYDRIVSNITLANSYNLDFKNDIDESLYRMVARNQTVYKLKDDADVKNPYNVIADLTGGFDNLREITTDEESKSWIEQLSHNVEILRQRVDDIETNIETGGMYDENIEMLDNNIYILTELIQDDIQYYIYYQTRSIETLKTQLNKEINRLIHISICMIVVLLIIITTLNYKVLKDVLFNISKLVRVSRFPVASSARITAGLFTRARAMATRCC